MSKKDASKPDPFADAVAKARDFHRKHEQQPGQPVNVPKGWVTYAIPGDMPEDRRRPLRYSLEDRGYAPLSHVVDDEPSLGRIEYPTLPGSEIWVVPEMVARVHHEERKKKHDAAKAAVVAGAKGNVPAGLEGAGMMMQR